jgi:predicted NBD/HSP70 family sugar kinase
MKKLPFGNTADQYWVKEHNLSILLKLVWDAGRPISRPELKILSGLNKMTVCNLMAQLEEMRLVRESGIYQPANSGRPGILYEINPEGGLIVGVEVNITEVIAILTNLKGEILWRFSQKVPGGTEDIFPRAEEIIGLALDAAHNNRMRIFGIGVAVAALVAKDGEISVFPETLGPVKKRIVAGWQEKFHLPVFVSNDGNASAVCELLLGEASKFEDDFLFINVGNGLGAGIISNGELLAGKGGFAGEVGHMTIDPQGKPCKCGNRGCWENYVSLTASIEYWINHPAFDVERYTSRLTRFPNEDYAILISAARDQDKAAIDAFATIGRSFGVGLASLINIFNPRNIFLGGLLCMGSEFFMPALVDEVSRRSFKPIYASLQSITVVENSMDVASLGAVALVIREVLVKPSVWSHRTMEEKEVSYLV